MNKEKPLLIVQARTGSSRLPKKMLLPIIDDKSVLDVILERLVENFSHQNIIIATTTATGDDDIVEIATRHDINVFRGSEHDVLSRFINAADKYNAKKVIRICADNVFMDISQLDLLYRAASLNDSFDYISFITDSGTPSIKTHFGFWAEAVTTEALKKVRDLTTDAVFHEHVTNFIYSNPNIFRCCFIPIDRQIQDRPSLRLTLDTLDDYTLQKEIYSHFIENNIPLTPKNIIAYLDIHQGYYVKMQKNINQNTK
ncbi:glycosyl transferase family 2 [Bacteroides caecimuris]|jgi:spore coat polysaccharide biosynthesis protein SpsF|uniref:cytidylyltransferase domain-containing protein n=1 Tax=Bacteroides caecimuris TaxID=1796613 RepID=UPI002659D468|nr:glycosyl transferase family 2 [Bacteroides caecimuris]